MTDWGYYEAARRFQRVLVASGVDSALRAGGALVGAAPLCHMPLPCRPNLSSLCDAASLLPQPLILLRSSSPPHAVHFDTCASWSPNSASAPGHANSPGVCAVCAVCAVLQEGDTVIIGDLEFDYSEDKSEAGMYEKWYRERKAAGIVGKGQARWPHVTG